MKKSKQIKFEKGKTYHLDEIYELQGLIPHDCFDFKDGDSLTDQVVFKKTFELKYEVIVYD